jgi:hypothetical protein
MADKKIEEEEVVNLQFSVLEAARLVEILVFCKGSCHFLAIQEELKGTQKSADKYTAMSEDSGALADYIANSVSMGEPVSDEFH